MLRKIFLLVLIFALVVPCAYARKSTPHTVMRVSDLDLCPAGRSCVDGSGNMKMGAATIGTSSLRDNSGTMQVSNGGGAYQNIGTATASISDVAYPTGWNADTVNGASRNAIYDALQAFLPISQIGAAYDTEAELAALLASHPHQDVGTSANPSFASVHASGGNLAAANRQVVKAWQTGLPYVANLTAVVYGGKVYVCTSSHTAGSTTEPGVGASWATVWSEVSGAGDDLGSATYSSVVALWASGSCTGRLLSDGTCNNDTYLTAETDPSALLTAGTDNIKDTHVDWGDGAGQIGYADFVARFGSGSCSGYLKSDGTCDTPSGSGDDLGDANATDVVALFDSGSCGATEYMKGDGTCDTPSGAAHDAVTLSTDLGNNLLGLSTQQITLDTQTANYIFAGPATGGAVAPAFRAMVDADIPSAIARDTELHAAVTLGSGIGGLTISTQELSLATRLEAYHDWTDPNADQIWFWDDSAGAFTGLTLGTGLSISTTTLNGPDVTAYDTAEERQDESGAMWTGNTETGITVTYQDADGTIDAVVTTATDSALGIVELSTDAESVTGSSDAVVVTPGTLTARLAAPGAIGGTTPAAGAFTTLSAGAGGMIVDADGDTTVKSITTAATAAPGYTPYDSDSPGTDKTAGFIGWQYVDGADGAENSDFLLRVMQGGTLTTVLAFDESDDQWETSKAINSSGGFIGNLTGTASAVTNATLTAAITVQTGPVTITGNAGGSSAITIPNAAVNLVAGTMVDTTNAKLNRYHQTAHFDPDNQYATYGGVLVLDPKTAAAITVTDISVYLNENPTNELTVTLLWKAAAIGYTGGTTIDVNDTVNGTFTATSAFDDATIPAGSKIWLLIGDNPDATTIGMEVSLTGTYD